MLEKEKKIPVSDAVGKEIRIGFMRKASLTVEAAFVVPLFIFCMIALICMVDIYGTYARKTVELQELSEQSALAAAALTGENEETDYIDLAVPEAYTVRGMYVPGILIACRGRVYPWTGRNPGEDTSVYDEGDDEAVYMTENGSVYHTSTACTHLQLDIRCVSSATVGMYRNEDGSKYQPCEKCVGSSGAASTVYIGRDGDCYHNSASCSGLTRHIHIEKLSEVEGISQCSRCAQLSAATATSTIGTE